MKYIVNFSGGLSSFEALRRTIEQHGKENTIAVFADVRGDVKRDPHAAPLGTNWDGEDEDVYRFLEDVERLFDLPIHRVQHPQGLGVWGAIFQQRAIIMRQSDYAPCSELLKQKTVDSFVEKLRWPHKIAERAEWTRRKAARVKQHLTRINKYKDNPIRHVAEKRNFEAAIKAMLEWDVEYWAHIATSPVTRVFGLHWNEMHRVDRNRELFRAMGEFAEYPLVNEPHISNCQIAAYLHSVGMAPPRSYSEGFPHANCGGGCVRGGISSWALLWKTNPGRYLYNERNEAEFRRTVNAKASILRDRSGGQTRALPLSELREKLESGYQPREVDFDGCGCFIASPMVQISEMRRVTAL